MIDMKKIVDKAELIVNGYAFRKCDREILKTQSYIKDNYKDVYLKWFQYSEKGFYGEIR